MNEPFLDIDLLGTVYINEVYEFYDEPLLFSCKNMFEHIFLSVCIDFQKDKKIWYYLPISQAKLILAKKKQKSLYELFKNPEGNFLWQVHEYYEKKQAEAKKILSVDLDDISLPEKNTYIEYKDSEDKKIFNDESRLENAIKEKRDIFDVSFEVDGEHGNEIPSMILGKNIETIQRLIYYIAYIDGNLSSQIPKSIKESTTLNVTDNYAASFGVRFKSDDISDLHGKTKVQDSVKILMKLLNPNNKIQNKNDIIKGLNPNVGYRYKKMLENLFKDNISVKAYLATPSREYYETSLNTTQTKKIIDEILLQVEEREEQETYYGEIVGINVDKNKFEFITNDGDKIDGKISEVLNKETFEVPIETKVIIKKASEYNRFTLKDKITYWLIEIINN